MQYLSVEWMRQTPKLKEMKGKTRIDKKETRGEIEIQAKREIKEGRKIKKKDTEKQTHKLKEKEGKTKIDIKETDGGR